MIKYSVAIRTLGKSPETLRRELISLNNQTIKPEEIIIYIAKGYKHPDFTVGIERYVEVNKGMVAQRALAYDEITADYILLLDDDVILDSRSAEHLLGIIQSESADCVACDTFRNHRMSVKGKLRAALSNLVFPRFNKKWAFKIHNNGSFSYINHPTKPYYKAMSAAGPASLWKKTSLLDLHLSDELWLDNLGFSYGDDALEFYKLYVNGGKLLVAFDCGVENLDAKSSSKFHHQSNDKFRRIGKAQKLLWNRMIYCSCNNEYGRIKSKMAFGLKVLWIRFYLMILSLHGNYRSAGKEFWQGIIEANKFIDSEYWKNLPPYKMIKH